MTLGICPVCHRTVKLEMVMGEMVCETHFGGESREIDLGCRCMGSQEDPEDIVDQSSRRERRDDILLEPLKGEDWEMLAKANTPEKRFHPCSCCGDDSLDEDKGEEPQKWYLCFRCIGSPEAIEAGFTCEPKG